MGFRRIWELRGYAILLTVLTVVSLRGAPVAAIDVGLIMLILALSKDGEVLFGHLSRSIRAIEWMRTPQAAAVLMVMPIKTFTALVGAENEFALRAVAQHATIGLVALTLLLGLAPSVFRRFRDTGPEEPQREKAWIIALDLCVLLLLLALGRDGAVLFGDGAIRLQNSLPLLHEPWMRGLIAAIPVKTVSTLLLAGSWKRRTEIAIKGVPLMATLAVLTLGVATASELGMVWAYAIGAIAALAMLKTTSNYRVFLQGS